MFDDQLEKICGDSFIRDETKNIIKIPQVILVEAKKSKTKNKYIEKLITDGFYYNGVHYIRYGKSASQGKAGVTLFLDESVYQDMFFASQLGIEINECVISKYEAQRNLTLSVCTLIDSALPYIVIVDEYTKIIKDQEIRYVVEYEDSLVDKKTGKLVKFNNRRIEDGTKDVKISPFDGCGCHDKSLSELWSSVIGLDYVAIGEQIRLPFFKGYSVEVPFKEIFQSMGVSEITDIFGKKHKVENIDCIWNVSMWKGYKLFRDKYGNEAWDEYINALNKFGYKLGISKYSHHKKDFPLKTKMNYQYLQCLDLWNPKYIKRYDDSYESKRNGNGYAKYNILDKENWGKIINLASYSTNLYEKIIKGEKLYSYKFLGIEDTKTAEANGKYLEAVLINDVMLKDVAIKQFIYRKLKKAINQMKYGKIYADGYYHTVCGDMIGYLQFVAGKEVIGCLSAKEFYCDTIPKGKALSFRSPLVCPSEVNDVNIVSSDITCKWFSHFKDQDVVMINMHDLSMPQQGGMDADGDAVFLCYDQNLVSSKIHKRMIIDIEDKATAKVEPYNAESILKYEMNSRDNRIGEITTVATCIENQYVKNSKWKKICDDNISLLRIFQGKEIDFIKTGLRWNMNKGLKKQGSRLPYFLLYNYPDKLKRYYKIQKINEGRDELDKIPSNAYHSPSPLNELCDYIINWERKNINWDRSCVDTRCLIINNNLSLNNKLYLKQIKHTINDFCNCWREYINNKDNGEGDHSDFNAMFEIYRSKLESIIPNDKTLLGNYVIKVSYSNTSMSKVLAWQLFGDIIISNLKSNTPNKKRAKIIEVPYQTSNSHEYLGKYYEVIDGVIDV